MQGSAVHDSVAAHEGVAATKLEVLDLTIRYGSHVALSGVSMEVREHEILGIIGPANAGKTSLLKVLNRMDLFDSAMQFDGTIRFDGVDTRRWRNVYALRKRVGVVFPLPVGLPLTVYDNVALAPRLAGVRSSAELDVIVERCLRRAALWDEVKDRLRSLGSLLSGGQQQRLTIARALSQDPELLMLDEFSIAVDPVTTMRIEDVLKELRRARSPSSSSPTSCSRRAGSPTGPRSFSKGAASRSGRPTCCSAARSRMRAPATTSRASSAERRRCREMNEVIETP